MFFTLNTLVTDSEDKCETCVCVLQSSSLMSRIPVLWLTVLVTQTECVSSRPSVAYRYNVSFSVSVSNVGFYIQLVLVHVRAIQIL